jgi:hypothetical protein
MKKLMMLIVGVGLFGWSQSGALVWAFGTNPTVSDGQANTAGGTAALTTCFNTSSCAGNAARDLVSISIAPAKTPPSAISHWGATGSAA